MIIECVRPDGGGYEKYDDDNGADYDKNGICHNDCIYERINTL